MKTKTYLIGIIAIIGFVALIQGASADGAGINITCGYFNIVDVQLSEDSPGTVNPELPKHCAGVVPCDRKPTAACIASTCTACSKNCVWAKSSGGSYIADEGKGTHCMADNGLQECGYQAPAGSCADETCAYDANSQWVGEWKGGYAYDQTDGYKMGLKTVNVSVVISASGTAGIKQICTNGQVKIDIDNYDMKGGYITLNNPAACTETPNAPSATWKGSFKMHYWEKPGTYEVSVHVKNCCDNVTETYKTFDYASTAWLCIAPEGKTIDYPDAQSCENIDSISEAIGDDITSNCSQCDIGSKKATIRNIGNAVSNANIKASDLICQDATCTGDVIPVSHVPNQYGVVWVKLNGADYTPLWNEMKTENLKAQSYCNKTVPDGCCATKTVWTYGLPPGPHATNEIDLKIDQVPCVGPGYYKQTITLSAEPVESCCQDHREVSLTDSRCINPPQCYEFNRYSNVMTWPQFSSTCAPNA